MITGVRKILEDLKQSFGNNLDRQFYLVNNSRLGFFINPFYAGAKMSSFRKFDISFYMKRTMKGMLSKLTPFSRK